MSSDLVKIKRALISVTDKTGVANIAKALVKYGVEIISTGGTAKHLQSEGVDITPIQDITGNPEVFSGRMKSLSFQVSSGLLFRRDNVQDVEDAKKLGIKQIDLVICNLYPFVALANETEKVEDLVELIDVGGPTMIRSGAKNFNWVTVCTDPSKYSSLEENLKVNNGQVTSEFRTECALEAFRLLGHYDASINLELSRRLKAGFSLRYGENPHQRGFVVAHEKGTLADIIPLQGKKLSYNNYLDADSAINAARDIHSFNPGLFGVTVIKHQNPCGVSLNGSGVRALEDAWNGDFVSSFGSVIAFTKNVDEEIAHWLSDKFVELLIAPKFSDSALAIFAKKKNLRVIEYDFVKNESSQFEVRSIDGGVAVQDRDNHLETELNSVTNVAFPKEKEELARFAIISAKHLRSNAISLVRAVPGGVQLIGAGMGNPNRLISVEQAIEKAKENGVVDFTTVVLASDAFFPFSDNIEKLAASGIKYVVQPGGSIKDEDVIAECNKREVSMIFTKTRHFKH